MSLQHSCTCLTLLSTDLHITHPQPLCSTQLFLNPYCLLSTHLDMGLADQVYKTDICQTVSKLAILYFVQFSYYCKKVKCSSYALIKKHHLSECQKMILLCKTDFISKSIIIIFFILNCVCGTCRSQKHQISVKLELQVVLSALKWVPRTKPFSTRTVVYKGRMYS